MANAVKTTLLLGLMSGVLLVLGLIEARFAACSGLGKFLQDAQVQCAAVAQRDPGIGLVRGRRVARVHPGPFHADRSPAVEGRGVRGPLGVEQPKDFVAGAVEGREGHWRTCNSYMIACPFGFSGFTAMTFQTSEPRSTKPSTSGGAVRPSAGINTRWSPMRIVWPSM